MGLRVATNIASQRVQANLKKVSNATDKELERLSSGKRITQSADDAAGLAISTSLDAQTRGLKQAVRNANDGVSLIQTAEGGLNEIGNILIRLRELSVQGASDTVGEKERALLNMEFTQLNTEIDRIAAATKFNGTAVINGTGSGTLDFQVGAFSGEENIIQFDSSATDATGSSLGISGNAIEDRGGAKDAILAVDEAIDKLSSQRANLGAIQSRLQSTVANLDGLIINQDRAKSVVQDTDVAASTANIAAKQVIKNAGVTALIQANNIPYDALRLINS